MGNRLRSGTSVDSELDAGLLGSCFHDATSGIEEGGAMKEKLFRFLADDQGSTTVEEAALFALAALALLMAIIILASYFKLT